MNGCLAVICVLLFFPLLLAGICGGGGAPFALLLTAGTIAAVVVLSLGAQSESKSEADSMEKEWAEKADTDDKQAMYICAFRYEGGFFGFPKDMKKARDYYSRAAALGHKKAIARLKQATRNPTDVLNESASMEQS